MSDILAVTVVIQNESHYTPLPIGCPTYMPTILNCTFWA